MEKNYWLALILSMMILMGYPWILKKFYPQKTNQVSQTANQDAGLNPEIKAAIGQAAIEKKEEPKEKRITLRNGFYKAVFSSRGAGLQKMIYSGENKKAHLKDIVFYQPSETQTTGNLETRLLNEEIDLSKVLYRVQKISETKADFIYEKPGAFRFTKTIHMDQTRPLIVMDLSIENLSAAEKHFPLELLYAFFYKDSKEPGHHDVESVYFQEKAKSEKLDKIKKKGFLLSGEKIEWAGMVKKYFAILIKADARIISNENHADDQNLYAAMRFEPMSVAPGAKKTQQVLIYAGPQKYETLKELGLGFEEILSRGFFGVFKIWLLVSLKFFYQFTGNFGWAIILLTLALKLLFTPLTHMSYESMRKMQAVQPKLKAIQERLKNDPQKMNREVMELYKRNKVNPMGGCLPMLAQIPVFIAFYQVLSETIELKGAPFLFWIQDLAQPDRLFPFPFIVPILGWDAFNLLPVFMIGSMVWQQKLTPQTASSPEQEKMMQIMPIMMGFLFYQMPAGLVLYWFLNNMLTVFHQLVIKRMGAVVLHHEDQD